MNPMKIVDRLLGRTGQSGTSWIEAQELQRRLTDATPPAILDVRGPDEFAGDLGHIANAINIPLGEFPGRMNEIAALAQGPLVLVCLSDKRSARAADLLRNAGLNDVSVLRGGMEQWKGMGFPATGLR